MPQYSYEINPRPENLGGGWKLQLFEDGEEVGGGVFKPGDNGYCDALGTAHLWLDSRE